MGRLAALLTELTGVPHMWWVLQAIRGGGPLYGIVTSWTFKLHKAPAKVGAGGMEGGRGEKLAGASQGSLCVRRERSQALPCCAQSSNSLVQVVSSRFESGRRCHDCPVTMHIIFPPQGNMTMDTSLHYTRACRRRSPSTSSGKTAPSPSSGRCCRPGTTGSPGSCRGSTPWWTSSAATATCGCRYGMRQASEVQRVACCLPPAATMVSLCRPWCPFGVCELLV